MVDLATLTALRERVIAAKGPDQKLDSAIWLKTSHQCKDHGIDGWTKYTASIDAALALVGRMLPGHGWSVGSDFARQGQPFATIGYDEEDRRGSAFAHTPPLAILAALLSALIAMETAG